MIRPGNIVREIPKDPHCVECGGTGRTGVHPALRKDGQAPLGLCLMCAGRGKFPYVDRFGWGHVSHRNGKASARYHPTKGQGWLVDWAGGGCSVMFEDELEVIAEGTDES